MDSLLVTGGAGFIGSNLVRRALATTADRVVVLDNLTYAGSAASLDHLPDRSRFVFVQGDIADRELVDAVFREHRPRAVLNLAAETHVDRSIDDPRPFVRHQHPGHLRAARGGAQVSRGATWRRRRSTADQRRAAFRFLHVSTDEVFGTLGAEGSFSEETAVRAATRPTPPRKAAADHLVRAYHHTFGLPTIVTNCSNNYGPYQFPEKLIPLMILNAIERQAAADLRRRRPGARLALRRGPLRRAARGARARRARRELQPRRRAASAPTSRSSRALCALLEELLPPAGNPAMRARGLTAYAALETRVADRPGHDRRYAIDASQDPPRARLGAATPTSTPGCAPPCAGTSITPSGARRRRGEATAASGWGCSAEGHPPRRRHRHAPLPGQPGRLQAAGAGLRQADGLLPAVDADAGRHPRDPHHHHAGGSGRLQAAARRRQAARPRAHLRGAAQAGGNRAGVPHRSRLHRQAARCARARRQHLLRPGFRR